MNWRGRPLNSYEVVVNSIAATTTRTGLTVHAKLGPGSYPAGAQVTDAEMDALPLTRHNWHGDWNCTLRPEPPARTGLDPAQWDQFLTALHAGADEPPPIRHGRQPGAGGGGGDAVHDHLVAVQRASAKCGDGGPEAEPQDGDEGLAGEAEVERTRSGTGCSPTSPELVARLWTVSASTIKTAQDHAWPLLVQAGYPTEPAGPRLRTLSDLTAYASDYGITFTPKQTGYLCTVPRFIHSAPSRVAIRRRHRKPRQS